MSESISFWLPPLSMSSSIHYWLWKCLHWPAKHPSPIPFLHRLLPILQLKWDCQTRTRSIHRLAKNQYNFLWPKSQFPYHWLKWPTLYASCNRSIIILWEWKEMLLRLIWVVGVIQSCHRQIEPVCVCVIKPFMTRSLLPNPTLHHCPYHFFEIPSISHSFHPSNRGTLSHYVIPCY